MTQSQDQAARGMEMTNAEIDNFLSERGFGTLSLADSGDAYAVPISFGYNGERLFMYLVEFGDSSQKLAYSRNTATACLTAYMVESQYEWASVIVRGSLEEVPEDEQKTMEEVMESNAWHPSLYPPLEPTTGIDRFELVITEASGRKGLEYSD